MNYVKASIKTTYGHNNEFVSEEIWDYWIGKYDNDHSIVVRIRGDYTPVVYAQVFNHNNIHLPEFANDRPEDARALSGKINLIKVGTYRGVFKKNFRGFNTENVIDEMSALEVRNRIFEYSKGKIFSE